MSDLHSMLGVLLLSGTFACVPGNQAMSEGQAVARARALLAEAQPGFKVEKTSVESDTADWVVYFCCRGPGVVPSSFAIAVSKRTGAARSLPQR